MAKKILIIEDEEAAYNNINTLLKEAKYSILPPANSFKEFRKLLKKSKDDALKLIDKIINEHYEDLHLIICDLDFDKGDDYNGVNIINYIRENISLQNKPFFCSTIPIIILTKHDEKKYEPTRIKALEKGAIIIFTKNFGDDTFENEFLGSIKSLIKYFSYYSNIENIQNFQFDRIRKIFIDQNEIIISKVNDVEILIETKHLEISKKLEPIFMATYNCLNTESKKKFIDQYEMEVKDLIGDDNFRKLKISKWTEVKNAFSEINEGGGFEKFISTIVDMLEEAGILDSGVGKLTGIALKGVFGILSAK